MEVLPRGARRGGSPPRGLPLRGARLGEGAARGRRTAWQRALGRGTPGPELLQRRPRRESDVFIYDADDLVLTVTTVDRPDGAICH